jgi:DNA helicase-2/ATP-dependent DNA helicase PcrA
MPSLPPFRSAAQRRKPRSSGDRAFHIKFGNGNVVAVDGNKLTILFDKAGEKRVVDRFVERV